MVRYEGMNKFFQVNALSDDAITVRIQKREGRVTGTVDFPTFQMADGRIIRSTDSSPYPIKVALEIAVRLLPMTPFFEVHVQLQNDIKWNPEWGSLMTTRD